MFLQSLMDYILISAPYLLFGLVIAGILHAFITKDRLAKLFGKGFWGIIRASLVGVPLPLCSCSVIPTAITLKKNGADNATTSSFLISTPETGVDSIILTYGLMGPAMAIVRPIAAFFIATYAGLLQLFFNNKEEISKNEGEKTSCCCSSEMKTEEVEISLYQKLKMGFKYSFGTLFEDMALWMTVGLLLGALINTLVPESFFTSVDMWQSRGMILLIGIPLYVCASASTPIAAALMMKGISPGTALLFLIVGPATNFTNLFVMQNYIGKKGVLLNLFAIATGALLVSYLVDLIFITFSINVIITMIGHQHEEMSMINYVTGALFSLLLVRGLFLDLKGRFFKPSQQ